MTRAERTRFVVALGAILLLAAAVRGLFPLADPPVDGSAGVVWHDEGAWVHNARNRVLFGAWITDAWNPLFITPVLTGLEYVSFQLFGVGLWQARLVSQVLGVLSVAALAAGVARIATPAAGLVAGALLATSYTYVMYDRAAVMEGTMVAFLVVSWWCYVRASDAPGWGIAAAIAAFLAFFTKATAVFFLVALGMDALIGFRLQKNDPKGSSHIGSSHIGSSHMWTLAALVAVGCLALTVFVVPYWDQYRFYNWETSVTRRPSYSLAAFKDRITWFPIVHDFFTRMAPVTMLAVAALLTVPLRLRRLHPGERLLVWWVGLGTLELLARDVGNERYFVYLAPAMVALAALFLAAPRQLAPNERLGPSKLGPYILVLLFVLYVAAGSIVRIPFRSAIMSAHELQMPVRISAAIAVLLTIAALATWPRLSRAFARISLSPGAAIGIAAIIVFIDLAQLGSYAAARTYKNYSAMRELAETLPPETPVHGKLANGLALESRIRPIFVGNQFGNYDDRFQRDDVNYLLTYTSPRLAYEGVVIREVLETYPERRIVRTFEVAETPAGNDRAALFEKRPTR